MGFIKDLIVIAEIGVNHNGDIKKAKKLIDISSKLKVDFVKFQTFKASNLVTKYAMKAQYQIKNFKQKENSQLQMLKKYELSLTDHVELINYCKIKRVNFLSTPFDLESFLLLQKLKLKSFKISSGDINNIPLLRKIAKSNSKIFISTGMSNLNDVSKAIREIKKFKKKTKDIYLMQCNTDYPTPDHDVNLNVLKTFKNKFDVNIGYSDHSLGVQAPVIAYCLGAKVIEKHITLSKSLRGPDHKASANPKEFEKMMKLLKNTEIMLGRHEKKITNSERKNIIIARKSIVAIKMINKGDKFSPLNISVKRPGSGIPPSKWDKVIGKKAKKNYNPDDLI